MVNDTKIDAHPPKDHGRTPGSSWWAASAAFTLSLAVLLSPLLRHAVDPMWDAYDFFFPAFGYLADSIREGRWPLWDPYTNCGYPFHADPSNFTLNPLALVLGLLIDSPSYGLLLFWVFNWWWGGLGMLQLSRHFGAAPAGAFVAAISYALSGFFLAHAEHISFILVAAWLPWLFMYAEQAVQRCSLAHALLGGACLGLCTYGGYPGLLLFACLALGFWLLVRFLPEGEISAPVKKRIWWIGLTLGIIAVIFSAAWSPTLNAFLVEGRGYTERVKELAINRATMNEPFTWKAAFSLFFPYSTFVGRPWLGADISMTNAYMGILAFPLAFHWLRTNRLRRSWWLIAFVIAMFLVSLGGQYGLRTLLYHLFPPSRFMQYNAPFRLFWILPLCLAAGLGFSRLLQNPEEFRSVLKSILCWTVITIAAGFAFTATATGFNTPVHSDALQLFAPAAGILASCIFLLLTGIIRPDLLPAKVAAYLLVLLMLADMSCHLYTNSGTVWNHGGQTKYVESFHQRSTAQTGSPAPRVPGRPFGYLNAQQLLKQPLVQGYLTMLSEDFDKTLCASRFAEVMAAPYRFWLSPGVEVPTTRNAALQALSQTGIDSPAPVFIDGTSEGLPATRTLPGTFGSVHINRYAPERIEMIVQVPGTNGAFLASTERYTPGWRAVVDGMPQRVLKTNLFFRGIFVPSGTHTVVWEYVPERWAALVWVSYLTVALALASGLVLIAKDKRR